MVRRSDRANGDTSRKKLVKGTRGRRQRRGKRHDDDDTLEEQQDGVLNLNNPLIPPELDEDIDDDLAFNSDDEERYGHFFQKRAKVDTAAGAKAKKSKKGSRAGAQEGGDAEEALVLQQLRALGEIDDEDDLDFHDGDGDDDDDNDEYIDLVDMLDAENGKEEGKETRNGGKKSKNKIDKGTVAKKRRRTPVTEEAESIYGLAAVDKTYSSAIQDVVAATPASSLQSRMKQTLENRHNIISVDVDDHKKAAMTRSEVRKVVEEDLAKYKSVLREQRESKHVLLPMQMPESNPVPKTLGAIAAAAQSRFNGEENEELTASNNKEEAGRMGGNATRVSAFRLAGKMSALLSRAGLSKPGLSAASAEDGVVPFGDDDDDNNNNARATRQTTNENVPTTSYMAKLKAMLSSENARRRRMNRIKSKTYRRILRKEKEREKERREKAFELLHPEKARARLAEKLLKARMEERVTQKHKNTSKWVRHAKRFANFDGDTKDAINEQNLLHQKLMQKMEEAADEDEFLNAAGDARADSEAASSEEERVVDYLMAEAAADQKQERMNGEATGKKKNMASLLWKSVDDVEKEENGEAETSNMTVTEKARAELRQMKFMQQAKKREEKHYAEMLEQLQSDIRRDMLGEALSSNDEPSDLDEDTRVKTTRAKVRGKLSTAADVNVGRKAFLQKGDKEKDKATVESLQLKRQRGIDVQVNDTVENVSSSMNNEAKDNDEWSIKDGGSSDSDENDQTNNTVDTVTKSTKRGQRVKDKFVGKSSLNVSSVAPLLDASDPPATRKRTSSTRITILPADIKRARGENVATVENVQVIKDEKQQGNSPNMREVEPEKKEEEYDNEATLQQQQDYLIARAFADDEIDADFLAEKAAQVETIMRPVDKNATLPGWGEWGGADERLNTRHQKKLQAMELQRQIEKTTLLKSRADAELDHVIINHDGVELVPDRMLLHMIPRPFSNPTEFARSMRHPQGPEWNTALTFKDANQPRVEVRQGHAVLPLDLSLRGKKKIAKTKRRKTAAAAETL